MPIDHSRVALRAASGKQKAQPPRRGRGRPRALSDADEDRIAAARDLDGLSLAELEVWCGLELRAGVSRSTIRNAITRSDQRLGIYAQSDGVIAQGDYPLRPGADSAAQNDLANGDNAATPDAESASAEVLDFASPAGSPLGSLQGERGRYSPSLPAREQLRRQVAKALYAQVQLGLDRGDRHPLFWSPSITDEDLRDFWDRWRMMVDGRPPWEALSGWRPLHLLRSLLDSLEVCVGFASLHFAPRTARPHFHVPMVVPVHVTPEYLDTLWSDVSGMEERGRLGDRCKPFLNWESAQRALAGLRNDLDVVLPRLRNDCRYGVNYSMQGADSAPRGDDGDRDHVPHGMPKAIRERQASDYLVWASSGLVVRDWDSVDLGSMTADELESIAESIGVDLGAVIDERIEAAPRRAIASASEPPTACACGCGKLLPPIRRKNDLRASAIDERRRIHKPRADRRYLPSHRQKRHRGHRRVLSILGRLFGERVN